MCRPAHLLALTDYLMDYLPPQPLEPAPTRFDLRGRLFGAEIRIHPFFWPAAAAIGWNYYAWPDVPHVGLFFLWLLCVILSLLIHDLGHLAMGRLFGARLGTVWYGLGSQITGLETLPRRPQRLAVYLAGPMAQLLAFAAIWFLIGPLLVQTVTTWAAVREWALSAIGFFMTFSLIWGVLNLLPIWPLDGGLFLREWCAGLFGRSGPAIALVVCIFASAGIALVIGNWVSVYYPLRFDPRWSLLLHQYTILLLFSTFFVISGFRALRAEYRHWRGLTVGTSRPP